MAAEANHGRRSDAIYDGLPFRGMRWNEGIEEQIDSARRYADEGLRAVLILSPMKGDSYGGCNRRFSTDLSLRLGVRIIDHSEDSLGEGLHTEGDYAQQQCQR